MFQKIAARAMLAGTVLLIPSVAVRAQTPAVKAQTPNQTTGNVFTGTKNIESIVAWVNNDIILKSEYDKRVDEIRQQLAKDQKLKGAQLDQAIKEQTRGALAQMIDEQLLLQQAKELGITADLEVIKAMEKMRLDRKLASAEALEKEIISQGYTVDEVKDNIRTSYLTQTVMQREVFSRVTITNEDVRKYYDQHQKDFDRPAGIHLREITVLTENRGPDEIASQKKKIEEALAAVKKGEDFATIASKYSESQTAADGGDFGFWTKGELSPSLEAVVSKLDKGQVTDVLPVQGAFMIIKLDEKHNGGILPFELAQKEIQDLLWRKALPPKEKEYLTKLRNEGFIRVADGYVDANSATAAEKVSENK
ncbi:MAG TPA: peptidyl-prolyl cis-trans isomerase [Terriglobia bacterium]|jgi:parvulin-like peptidyl-prolyl isomerase